MKDQIFANSKLSFLLGLFIALMVGMNLLGGKIISLFGISVSVAIFMVPVTFLITDIVSEVYGKKLAKHFVFVGVAALVLMFLYVAVFVAIPPHERYTFNAEYVTIFGASLRIMVASVIAFLLSQLHDVWAFEYWREKMHGRFLWFRNNASTIVSQAIDTVAFMFIAFYKVAPKFDALFVLELALPYYLFKILFALIDTPFVYLGVRWLREKNTSSES